MNDTLLRSSDRLSPISDLDEKLVTIWSVEVFTPFSELFGTWIVCTTSPPGIGSISSIRIGAVTPKDASTSTLLNTVGWVPPGVGGTHLPPVRPGGRGAARG